MLDRRGYRPDRGRNVGPTPPRRRSPTRPSWSPRPVPHPPRAAQPPAGTGFWRQELPQMAEWFEFIGEKLPTGIKDEFDALKQRLS